MILRINPGESMTDSCGINNPTSTAGVRSPNPPRIYTAVVGGAPANTFIPIGIRFCDLYYDGFNDNVYMFVGASGGLATWQLLTGGALALPLVVSSGGTGDTTLTAHGVLIGEGTSPVQVTAAGTNGQVLTGATGANPAFSALGTNSGLTAHGVLIGEGNSAIAATAVGATGTLLAGATGADPAFTASPSVTGSLTAVTGLASSGVGSGLTLNPTVASGAASGTVTANGRVVSVTFTGVSIASGATQAFTTANSSITGSGTVLDLSWVGATAGSALSVVSVANTAGQSVITMTNGTSATMVTSTANITFTYFVLN